MSRRTGSSSNHFTKPLASIIIDDDPILLSSDHEDRSQPQSRRASNSSTSHMPGAYSRNNYMTNNYITSTPQHPPHTPILPHPSLIPHFHQTPLHALNSTSPSPNPSLHQSHPTDNHFGDSTDHSDQEGDNLSEDSDTALSRFFVTDLNKPQQESAEERAEDARKRDELLTLYEQAEKQKRLELLKQQFRDGAADDDDPNEPHFDPSHRPRPLSLPTAPATTTTAAPTTTPPTLAMSTASTASLVSLSPSQSWPMQSPPKAHPHLPPSNLSHITSPLRNLAHHPLVQTPYKSLAGSTPNQSSNQSTPAPSLDNLRKMAELNVSGDLLLSLECPICMDAVERPTMPTSCAHVYCHKCISSWADFDSACPCCKQRMYALLTYHTGDFSLFVEQCGDFINFGNRNDVGNIWTDNELDELQHDRQLVLEMVIDPQQHAQHGSVRDDGGCGEPGWDPASSRHRRKRVPPVPLSVRAVERRVQPVRFENEEINPLATAVENTVCQKCDGMDDNEDGVIEIMLDGQLVQRQNDMLLCDADNGLCRRGCHLLCHAPPLKDVPSCDWFCSYHFHLMATQVMNLAADIARKERILQVTDQIKRNINNVSDDNAKKAGSATHHQPKAKKDGLSASQLNALFSELDELKQTRPPSETEAQIKASWKIDREELAYCTTVTSKPPILRYYRWIHHELLAQQIRELEKRDVHAASRLEQEYAQAVDYAQNHPEEFLFTDDDEDSDEDSDDDNGDIDEDVATDLLKLEAAAAAVGWITDSSHGDSTSDIETDHGSDGDDSVFKPLRGRQSRQPRPNSTKRPPATSLSKNRPPASPPNQRLQKSSRLKKKFVESGDDSEDSTIDLYSFSRKSPSISTTAKATTTTTTTTTSTAPRTTKWITPKTSTNAAPQTPSTSHSVSIFDHRRLSHHTGRNSIQNRRLVIDDESTPDRSKKRSSHLSTSLTHGPSAKPHSTRPLSQPQPQLLHPQPPFSSIPQPPVQTQPPKKSLYRRAAPSQSAEEIIDRVPIKDFDKTMTAEHIIDNAPTKTSQDLGLTSINSLSSSKSSFSSAYNAPIPPGTTSSIPVGAAGAAPKISGAALYRRRQFQTAPSAPTQSEPPQPAQPQPLKRPHAIDSTRTDALDGGFHPKPRHTTASLHEVQNGGFCRDDFVQLATQPIMTTASSGPSNLSSQVLHQRGPQTTTPAAFTTRTTTATAVPRLATTGLPTQSAPSTFRYGNQPNPKPTAIPPTSQVPLPFPNKSIPSRPPSLAQLSQRSASIASTHDHHEMTQRRLATSSGQSSHHFSQPSNGAAFAAPQSRSGTMAQSTNSYRPHAPIQGSHVAATRAKTTSLFSHPPRTTDFLNDVQKKSLPR